MKIYDKFLRLMSPKAYIRRAIRRATEDHHKRMRLPMSSLERANANARHSFEMQEWYDWLRSIEDDEIVRTAQRMDIALDDFPKRYTQDDDEPDYCCCDSLGNRYLKPETRSAIQKAMRERASAYRKERRETVDLYVRLIVAITGLAGALIGILAFLRNPWRLQAVGMKFRAISKTSYVTCPTAVDLPVSVQGKSLKCND
jgi:hypothetical protein